MNAKQNILTRCFSGFLVLVWTLALPFLASCRKKKDESPPVITLISPVVNQRFLDTDEIVFKVQVQDDRIVEFIKVSIVDYELKPVSSVYENRPDAPLGIVVDYHQVDPEIIRGGNYYLYVSASDGVNTSSFYQPIVIDAAPLEWKAVYTVADYDGRSTEVGKIDSVFSYSVQYSVPGDHQGAAISSRYRSIYTAGRYTGPLQAYEYRKKEKTWQLTNPNSGFPHFTSLVYHKGNLLVGYYDGSIRGYNQKGIAGFVANSNSEENFYPGNIIANSSWLLAIEEPTSSSGNRLRLYTYPAGGAVKQNVFGAALVNWFVADENRFIIFCNKDNAARLYVYHADRNLLDNPRFIAGKFTAAVQVSSTEYVFCDGANLWVYRLSDNSLGPYLADYVCTRMVFDEVNRRLFCLNNGKVDIIDYQSKALIKQIDVGSRTRELLVQYNKEKS